MKSIDPARMAPAERLDELAELLAVGIQRALAKNIKPVTGEQIHEDQLDVLGNVEAPCGSPMEIAP